VICGIATECRGFSALKSYYPSSDRRRTSTPGERMTQSTKTLYEADFVQWSDRTAQLLREHRFVDLDLDHLIEEIEDLGNRHRDALESQLTRLLMHLLKYEFQPGHRSGSWLGSIKEARKQIKRLFRKYPSLKNYLEQCVATCYDDAIEDASDETELPMSVFPSQCPYAIVDILDPEFLPHS
jgi:Domain of unknown function DUF29